MAEQKITPDDTARMMEDGFRAWMLRFRHEAGRPLTAVEHALAKVAYATGYGNGFESGAEVMRQEMNEQLTAAEATP
jgi:hypothetical protein